MNPFQVSRELLARYGAPVPRYTSYPTAPVWQDAFPQAEAEELLTEAASVARPLSLYVHLPFCKKLCYYCGCNMLVTRSEPLVERYLTALTGEIARLGERFGKRRQVVQLHWGGGTPTYLNPEQLSRVHHALTAAFPFQAGAEQSIEVHPPVTSVEQVRTLASLGFNRVSMGVQDFDPVVQKAVNRLQPYEQTRDLIAACREQGFVSVNVDLMYGLPNQSVPRFDATLDKVRELRPERIALFAYAHLPSLKPHQKLIKSEELPRPPERVALFERAVERLTEMGYRYIGLDHFVLEKDDLWVAQQNGSLRRNFMGYTTCAESDVLATGSSSISDLDKAYLQDAREVHDYLERMESKGMAVSKGARLTKDDQLRRDAISDLFCNLRLEPERLEKRYGVEFASYFAEEYLRLKELERDGLVQLAGTKVRVTPVGQVLLRQVAAVFDAYLKPKAARPSPVFSQAI